MNPSSHISKALHDLGIGEDLPRLDTREALEQFVIRLFAGKKSTLSENLDELRWFLYSKYQYDTDRLNIQIQFCNYGPKKITSTISEALGI